MLTTITIEMSSEDKEKLIKILEDIHFTIDEAVEMFLRWVIDDPDEAAEWFKKQMEKCEK